MNYRNAPITGLQCTPAQLLQSREIRTRINVLHRKQLFKPVVQDCKQRMINEKVKQAKYYNRGANKSNISFEEGEKVYLQNKFTNNWSEGIIIKKLNEPTSYLIRDINNRLLRRNTIFIKTLINNGKGNMINEGEKRVNEVKSCKALRQNCRRSQWKCT